MISCFLTPLCVDNWRQLTLVVWFHRIRLIQRFTSQPSCTAYYFPNVHTCPLFSHICAYFIRDFVGQKHLSVFYWDNYSVCAFIFSTWDDLPTPSSGVLNLFTFFVACDFIQLFCNLYSKTKFRFVFESCLFAQDGPSFHVFETFMFWKCASAWGAFTLTLHCTRKVLVGNYAS